MFVFPHLFAAFLNFHHNNKELQKQRKTFSRRRFPHQRFFLLFFRCSMVGVYYFIFSSNFFTTFLASRFILEERKSCVNETVFSSSKSFLFQDFSFSHFMFPISLYAFKVFIFPAASCLFQREILVEKIVKVFFLMFLFENLHGSFSDI